MTDILHEGIGGFFSVHLLRNSLNIYGRKILPECVWTNALLVYNGRWEEHNCMFGKWG